MVQVNLISTHLNLGEFLSNRNTHLYFCLELTRCCTSNYINSTYSYLKCRRTTRMCHFLVATTKNESRRRRRNSSAKYFWLTQMSTSLDRSGLVSIQQTTKRCCLGFCPLCSFVRLIGLGFIGLTALGMPLGGLRPSTVQTEKKNDRSTIHSTSPLPSPLPTPSPPR